MRKIIHCGCSCFYVTIETYNNPRLVGKPSAVGGRPERRGVITTCNYEAHKPDIHSVVPVAQAVRCYPDLLIVPPSMEKYRQVARQIFAIYHSYTPLVESLSLDEAYLNVTDSPLLAGSGIHTAGDIRRRAREKIGITISADVASDKFTARAVSDWNRPDDLLVVRSEQINGFMAKSLVDHLFDVGKVTMAELRRLDAETCDDLHAWDTGHLQQYFGVFGFRLHDLCRGIDHRRVWPPQIRKSVSVEKTYAADLRTLDDYWCEPSVLVEQLTAHVERARAGSIIHKTYVRLRLVDLRGTIVECISPQVSSLVFSKLFVQGLECRDIPVRLLGVDVWLYESDVYARQQLLFAEGLVVAD